MSLTFAYLSSAMMAGAMVAVWLPGRWFGQPYWLWFFGAAIICAFPAQLLMPVALVWVIIALAACYLFQQKPSLNRWLILPVGVYLFVLGLGILPGFSRVTLIAP